MNSDLKSSFLGRLAPYLVYAEVILAPLILAGFAWMHLSPGTQLPWLGWALAVLAISYFLRAFMPDKQRPNESGKPHGFSWLLAFILAPKVSYIASAIAMAGLVIELHDGTGALQALMIATTSLMPVLLICGYSLITSPTGFQFLRGPVLRSIVIGGMSFYILHVHGIPPFG